MNNETLLKLLSIPNVLNRRGIRKRNGFPFQTGWLLEMVRAFEKSPAPNSITYEALITLDGITYKGEIEITNMGDLMIRRSYPA